MVNSLMDTPSEKQDDSPRPADNDEQNTPDEMEFITSVLDLLADQNSTSFRRGNRTTNCKWKELPTRKRFLQFLFPMP